MKISLKDWISENLKERDELDIEMDDVIYLVGSLNFFFQRTKLCVHDHEHLKELVDRIEKLILYSIESSDKNSLIVSTALGMVYIKYIDLINKK